MPQVTINLDGTIAVTLDAQEQALAVLLREEVGDKAFDEVFRLQFTTAIRNVMNDRFARLPQQDQMDMMAKMSAAKPPAKSAAKSQVP